MSSRLSYPPGGAAAGAVWGGITGTLADQTDLQAELDALLQDIGGKADLVHTHTADALTDATVTGKAVIRATDGPTARTAIGAGTSSFSGDYPDLTNKPTLGSLAAKNTVGTTDVDNDAITFAKLQNLTDARLLGRSAGSAGDCQEITVGSGLSLSGGALTATGGGGGPTIAYKATDQTAIGTTYADVTGTGLAVAANKAYAFEFVLICDADATTTGIDVACNGPASPTGLCYEQVYWTSATARTERCATAYDNNTGSTGSNGTAQKLFRVCGILRNGNNAGTLIARCKRENVGTGPNVRAGSYGLLWALN